MVDNEHTREKGGEDKEPQAGGYRAPMLWGATVAALALGIGFKNSVGRLDACRRLTLDA